MKKRGIDQQLEEDVSPVCKHGKQKMTRGTWFMREGDKKATPAMLIEPTCGSSQCYSRLLVEQKGDA